MRVSKRSGLDPRVLTFSERKLIDRVRQDSRRMISAGMFLLILPEALPFVLASNILRLPSTFETDALRVQRMRRRYQVHAEVTLRALHDFAFPSLSLVSVVMKSTGPRHGEEPFHRQLRDKEESFRDDERLQSVNVFIREFITLNPADSIQPSVSFINPPLERDHPISESRPLAGVQSESIAWMSHGLRLIRSHILSASGNSSGNSSIPKVRVESLLLRSVIFFFFSQNFGHNAIFAREKF